MFTRIALRICVQEALRGKTLAGDNVLDSQIAALDLDADGSLRTDQDKPFLSVYTDAGTIGAGNGLGVLFGEPNVELVIEAGISAAMVEEDPATGTTTIVGVGLPATDAALELSLDVMMRQAADALTDPDNPWAELVRSLLTDVSSIERSRVGQVANGNRLAAHELRIRAGTVQDPVKGGDLTGTTFEAFLAALGASEAPHLLAIKASIEAAIGGLGPDWATVQRELGLSNGQSISLGLRPLATDEAGVVPELDQVTIEVEGRDDEVVAP